MGPETRIVSAIASMAKMEEATMGLGMFTVMFNVFCRFMMSLSLVSFDRCSFRRLPVALIVAIFTVQKRGIVNSKMLVKGALISENSHYRYLKDCTAVPPRPSVPPLEYASPPVLAKNYRRGVTFARISNPLPRVSQTSHKPQDM